MARRTQFPNKKLSDKKEAEKLRRQRAALAAFGGHALRTEDLTELLQEGVALVSKAMESAVKYPDLSVGEREVRLVE